MSEKKLKFDIGIGLVSAPEDDLKPHKKGFKNIKELDDDIKKYVNETKTEFLYVPSHLKVYYGKDGREVLEKLGFSKQQPKQKLVFVEHFFRNYIFNLNFENSHIFTKHSYSFLGSLRVYSPEYYFKRAGFGSEHKTTVVLNGEIHQKTVKYDYEAPEFHLKDDKVHFSYWVIEQEPSYYTVLKVNGQVDDQGKFHVELDNSKSWTIAKTFSGIVEKIEEIKGNTILDH